MTVPTVLMRGAHAHPSIIATNEALGRVMPNAVQSVVEGAGHMLPISHPAPMAAVLRDLLARS